jgi:regulator of sirC expression with transglutaminase-like and TPR domain
MDAIWTDTDEIDCRTLLRAAQNGSLLDGLLAIEGPAPEREADCRKQLQTWSCEATALTVRWGTERQLDALEQVLFHYAGLEGDRKSYHHPHNSHITEVVARRRGTPILLSAIWIEVARSVGIEAEGVGMPGHFIARIDGQLIDPFDRGKRLDPAQCVKIVARLTQDKIPWDDRFLLSTPASQILERVLRNLVGSWTRVDNPVPLYRAAHMLAAIHPNPHNMLLHAGISERIGALRLALGIYKAIIDRHPHSREAMVAAKRTKPLHNKAQMLN